MTIRLRPAEERELDAVESLLSANDLPTADVGSDSARFYVGTEVNGDDGSNESDSENDDSAVGVDGGGVDGDGEPICVGGIEPYGRDGLLRSVVVRESARGEGTGAALCDALEDEARAAGIETLYLLTTTAADFFAARGYVEIGREDAPDSIRETTEFADLCSVSATCMKKSLR